MLSGMYEKQRKLRCVSFFTVALLQQQCCTAHVMRGRLGTWLHARPTGAACDELEHVFVSFFTKFAAALQQDLQL
jgi:hypothetical protein